MSFRQRVPGSNGEKLAFVFLNAELNIDVDTSFIVVMDGEGWKPGAVTWLNARALETDGFDVFSLSGLDSWLHVLLRN